MSQMTLFLDYDGVLHPDDVYLTRQGPKLQSTGELFMWVDLLDELLEEFPKVRIVLSTSWVRNLGYDKAKKRLPLQLQNRVIGSTWHSSMAHEMASVLWWDQASRHDQIVRYASRARLQHWVALDDDAVGWANSYSDRLVLTTPSVGISHPDALAKLRQRFAMQID